MPLPIPAPRAAGYTTTTTVPLYWAAYGRVGAPRALVLHGGPGADHRYLLPQMLRLAGSLADGTVLWMTGPATVRDYVVPSITKAAADADVTKSD